MKTKIKDPCPVCGLPMVIEVDSRGPWGIEEQSFFCIKDHYSYEFSYGGTIVHVGGYTFHWWYADNVGIQMRLHHQIQARIIATKRKERSMNEHPNILTSTPR